MDRKWLGRSVYALLGAAAFWIIQQIPTLFAEESKEAIKEFFRSLLDLSPVSLAIGLVGGAVLGAWLGRRRLRAKVLREAVYLRANVHYRATGLPGVADTLEVRLTLVGSFQAKMSPNLKALRGTLQLREWAHRITEGELKVGRHSEHSADSASDLLYEVEVPIPAATVRNIAVGTRLGEPPMAQVTEVYVVTDKGPVERQGPPTVVTGHWEDTKARHAKWEAAAAAAKASPYEKPAEAS